MPCDDSSCRRNRHCLESVREVDLVLTIPQVCSAKRGCTHSSIRDVKDWKIPSGSVVRSLFRIQLGSYGDVEKRLPGKRLRREFRDHMEDCGRPTMTIEMVRSYDRASTLARSTDGYPLSSVKHDLYLFKTVQFV